MKSTAGERRKSSLREQHLIFQDLRGQSLRDCLGSLKQWLPCLRLTVDEGRSLS